MKYESRLLTGYFNRSIDGAWVPCKIKKDEVVSIIGNGDSEIEQWFRRWEQRGNLKILCDFGSAKDSDYCVELINSCPEWE